MKRLRGGGVERLRGIAAARSLLQPLNFSTSQPLNFLLAALLLLLWAGNASAVTTEVYGTNVDAGGTDLRWDKYTPLSPGPWPAALVVHVGGYKSGNPGPATVATDLAAAGFLTFAIEHRLAPPAIAMQSAGPPGDPQSTLSTGRPPQQTDDVGLAIATARAYTGCNGSVVAVGGSSGAGHLLFAATFAAGTSRPDVVVCLSGIYDMADLESLGEDPAAGRNPTYSDNLTNYIGVEPYTAPSYEAAAKAASAYWQTRIATTPVPILLVSADADTIPKPQYDRTKASLIANGRDAEFIWRTTGSTNADSNEHAFSAWSKTTTLGGAFPILKNYAVDFLFRKLSVTPPPVGAAAVIVVKIK